MNESTETDRDYLIRVVRKQKKVDKAKAEKIVDKFKKPDLAKLVDACRNGRDAEYRQMLGLPIGEPVAESKIIELREGDEAVSIQGNVTIHNVGTFSQGSRSGNCVKLHVEP